MFPTEEYKIMKVKVREIENHHVNTTEIAAGKIYWRVLKSVGGVQDICMISKHIQNIY